VYSYLIFKRKFEGMKIPELREELRCHKAKLSGNKKDLIEI